MMAHVATHNGDKMALVMDDDKKMVDAIHDAFVTFAEGRIPSRNIPKTVSRYRIDVECATNTKAIGEQLRNYSRYDVFIVDKRFVDKNYNIHILSALRDLHVDSLRIVYTAYGDSVDMKECMRLGAWDYIDKGGGTATIASLVESTIIGLHEQAKRVARKQLDIEAHRYIGEHAKEIVRSHAGKFIALAQTGPTTDTWDCIAEDDNLFGLYAELSEKKADRDLLHITHID